MNLPDRRAQIRNRLREWLWPDQVGEALEMHDDAITYAQAEAVKFRLKRFQPCGCVICYCENQVQCLGCGAKTCRLHRDGIIENGVYEPHPAIAAAVKDERERIKKLIGIAKVEHFDAHKEYMQRESKEPLNPDNVFAGIMDSLDIIEKALNEEAE